MSWREEVVAITDGEQLLLYTDGVTEAQDSAGTFFELAGLLATLGADARRIAAGSDGALWFTQPGADKVGRITPGGELCETTCGGRYPAAAR